MLKHKINSSKSIIEKLEEIEKYYNEGKSLTFISKESGIHRQTIRSLLTFNNLPSRIDGKQIKRNINEYYFDSIDSEIKAYFLGFLYADGCNLYSKNRVTIELQERDKEILQKFSIEMFGKESISLYKRNGKNYFSLIMHGKHLSKKLAELGVVERKSSIISFPSIDTSLIHHFIRGFYDGDGCIYVPTNNRYSPSVSVIATKSMIDGIINTIQHLDIHGYFCKVKNGENNKMHSFVIKNYRQCSLFLNWLYKDASIFLKRKHNKYKEIIAKNTLTLSQSLV